MPQTSHKMWRDLVCLSVCFVLNVRINLLGKIDKTAVKPFSFIGSEDKQLSFKKSLKCLKLFTIRCNRRYTVTVLIVLKSSSQVMHTSHSTKIIIILLSTQSCLALGKRVRFRKVHSGLFNVLSISDDAFTYYSREWFFRDKNNDRKSWGQTAKKFTPYM